MRALSPHISPHVAGSRPADIAFFLRHPYSAEKKVVPAKSKALIDTQISIAVPVGCYGRVAPRSGLGMSSNAIAPIIPIIGIGAHVPGNLN